MINMLADTGHHMMEWAGGGWFWMGLMMIIGVILFVVVLYLLFRSFSQGSITSNAPSHGSPLDIAKRRYASGEIDQDEFERIKKDLKL